MFWGNWLLEKKRFISSLLALRIMGLDKIARLQEGSLDVWLVMEEGEKIIKILKKKLGTKCNLIYFTPLTSHNNPGREQSIKGHYNPERTVVIADVAFWRGNSFEEIFDVLKSLGYVSSKIYAYYHCGYTGNKSERSQYEFKETFGKAEDVQKIITKNLLALSES